jgi:hypothetical protein
LLSPTFMPRTALSNCSSIWPSPMMNWKPSALPPWKGSPSILPSKSMVTRSPRQRLRRRAQAEGAALLAQDLDGAVDGGVAHLGSDALDFGTGEVAELDLGVDLEGGVEGQLAFGRFFLLRDARRAGDAQLGFGGGLEKAWPTRSFTTSYCTE